MSLSNVNKYIYLCLVYAFHELLLLEVGRGSRQVFVHRQIGGCEPGMVCVPKRVEYKDVAAALFCVLVRVGTV